MLDALVGCSLGLVSGMRHALEPDHVAAVSTMLADQRSVHSSVRLAVAWGVGHALTLLGTSGYLFVLRTRMPARLMDLFELGVAFMLIALGVRSLISAQRADRAVKPARTMLGGRVHGALSMGLLHGLAGSGALAAMVMSSLPSLVAACLFMVVYALGALCGMAVLAGLFARLTTGPISHLSRDHARGAQLLLSIAGIFSAALGVVWGAPIVLRLCQ